jgi:hypothetical protein
MSSQAELARLVSLLSEALNRQASMRADFDKEKAARLEAEKEAALARLKLAAVEQLRENNYKGTGTGRQFP